MAVMSLVFERLLAYLRERGLSPSGRATTHRCQHILGAVKQMSDVEVMREAMWLALGALISTDAKWLMRWIPTSFTQNHSRAISNYRMSKQELAALIQQTGEETRWRLDQIASQAEVHRQRLPEVVQLARIWEEQYHDVNEAERNMAARQGKDKVAQRLRNPHDLDAVYGTKGQNTHQLGGFQAPCHRNN